MVLRLKSYLTVGSACRSAGFSKLIPLCPCLCHVQTGPVCPLDMSSHSTLYLDSFPSLSHCHILSIKYLILGDTYLTIHFSRKIPVTSLSFYFITVFYLCHLPPLKHELLGDTQGLCPQDLAQGWNTESAQGLKGHVSGRKIQKQKSSSVLGSSSLSCHCGVITFLSLRFWSCPLDNKSGAHLLPRNGAQINLENKTK